MIGDRRDLPKEVVEEIKKVELFTDACTGMKLVVAINYSGQYDLCQAFERLKNESEVGSPVTAQQIDSYLLTAELPPVDLIVRTGGERRLSNFFLWQAAYAEIHFQSKLWPDITANDLYDHISEFKTKERRYGRIS